MTDINKIIMIEKMIKELQEQKTKISDIRNTLKVIASLEGINDFKPYELREWSTVERSYRNQWKFELPDDFFSVPISYTEVRMPKKNKHDKEYRTLMIPNPELKALQRKLLKLFYHIGYYHSRAIGFVPHKNIRHHAEIHRNSAVILKFDIKDFFASITKDMVLETFLNSITINQLPTSYTEYRKTIERIVDIVTYNNQLPQGAPTSPIIANMVFFKFDKIITAIAKRVYKLKYSRYADDLVLSSENVNDKNKLFKCLSFIKHIIKPFSINDSKTRLMYTHKKAIICGIKINPDGKLTLPRAFRQKLRVIIHKHKLGQISENVYNGYRGYAMMINPKVIKNDNKK